MGRWSEEEESLLREQYPGTDNKTLSKKLSRSVASVECKASRMGLKKETTKEAAKGEEQPSPNPLIMISREQTLELDKIELLRLIWSLALMYRRELANPSARAPSNSRNATPPPRPHAQVPPRHRPRLRHRLRQDPEGPLAPHHRRLRRRTPLPTHTTYRPIAPIFFQTSLSFSSKKFAEKHFKPAFQTRGAHHRLTLTMRARAADYFFPMMNKIEAGDEPVRLILDIIFSASTRNTPYS